MSRAKFMYGRTENTEGLLLPRPQQWGDVTAEIGKRYGLLTVTKFAGNQRARTGVTYKTYECVCDCGGLRVAALERLRSGAVKYCKSDEHRLRIKTEDLVGLRKGSLVILKELPRVYYGKDCHRFVECRCDCGNTFTSLMMNVYHGSKISCGCTPKPRKTGDRHPGYKGHKGMSGSRMSSIMTGARKRGLEVTVTPEYLWNLFESQNGRCALTGIEIDVKDGGSASVDRIDSSKGYLEGNVQWVHMDLNFMKWDFDQSYFIEICRKVAARNPICPVDSPGTNN